MLQLPLLGSVMAGLSKGPGGERLFGGVGLDKLLEGAEGSLNLFSSELQALLMQMSPQMLQRLEAMLSGGMSLPQAANALLTESAAEGEGEGESFASLFGSRALPESGEGLTDPVDLLPARRETATHTVELPPVRAGGILELVQTLSAPGALATARAPGQGSTFNPLPAPLASSLLGMGVPQEVGGKGWGAAIADRVMWMVQGEQQVAKLKLNPPNLGPLEVRVSIQQDQASVSFMAQHAAVREALEAALPRLREMFDQQSMQLVRADVSDPGAQRDDRAHDLGGGGGGRNAGLQQGGEDGHDPAAVASAVVSGSKDGLIDLFA